MLTVVRQHVIAVLAESRACSINDFRAIAPAIFLGTDPYRTPEGELRQRHFLYRPSVPAPRGSAVVHDATVADVDSVMCIAVARGYYMRSKGRLVPRIERLIAEPEPATWTDTTPYFPARTANV